MAAGGPDPLSIRSITPDTESNEIAAPQDQMVSPEVSALQEIVAMLEDRGVRGVAYFDPSIIERGGSDHISWIPNLKSLHPLLKDIAYALFYRQNIPVAHELLAKMEELGDDCIDTMILRSECDVVMGRNEVAQIAGWLRRLKECVVRKVKGRARLYEQFVNEWDYHLKMNGRHLARVFLCYAAYCDFTKRFKPAKYEKMNSMILVMRKVAQRFLDVKSHRVRCLMFPTVRAIFYTFREKVNKMKDGNAKNKEYLKALCFNYEAWICIKNALDKEALECAGEGINILKAAYKDGEHELHTLYGDLLANMATAQKNLKQQDLALKTAIDVRKAYYNSTDLIKGIKREDLYKEFRKAGLDAVV